VDEAADLEWMYNDTMWGTQLRDLEKTMPPFEKYGYETWEVRYYSMYWELKHIRALGMLELGIKVRPSRLSLAPH